MKNILVFDGAINCTFPVYQATEEEFAAIFPAPGQDLELIEDFVDRVGEERANEVLCPLWNRPIYKRDAQGIHGILFYDSEERRRVLPASRREVDWDERYISQPERELYRRLRGE